MGHNGTIVVGADGDDGEGTNSGAVYVYHQDEDDNDWDKLIKLTASDANKYDLFGTSVSVYGDNILIGAEMGDGYDYDSGVAYIYTPIPRFAHVAEEGMAGWAIALITISSFGAAAAIGFVAYRYFLQHRGLVQDMDESRNAAGFWWNTADLDASNDSTFGRKGHLEMLTSRHRNNSEHSTDSRSALRGSDSEDVEIALSSQ